MSYLRSHRDLLLRFREGDRDALADVYRFYLPRVTQILRRGFVLRATGVTIPGLANRDDLADAIQDVFTRAFKRDARLAYDGLRDYWPYLSMIARNVVVSRHRRGGRELLAVDPAALAEADVDLNDAAEGPAWLDHRSLAIVRAYVSGLQEPMRAVHASRYVQALSQRDAAQQLGLSRPKVRKLENRLRRELLQLLTRAGLHTAVNGEVTTEPLRGQT
jgi:RNA polymerase sigma-70 factor (ECF subfamily)